MLFPNINLRIKNFIKKIIDTPLNFKINGTE